MEDQCIIGLYFKRSERAIEETDKKYGGYCYSIAYNILSNREDSQECVNDTYLAAWKTIPPRSPNFLKAFLGKLTRYISIDRWRKRNTRKRGSGEIVLSLDELEQCVAKGNPENELSLKELTRAMNEFLSTLSEAERNVFLSRYWYMDPIETISQMSGFSQSKVASMLYRLRGRLRKKLTEEGYV